MRRSTKAALAVVLVGAAMAGITTVPRGEEPDPPVAVEDPVPALAVRSSTRGLVALGGGPEAPGAGGTPHDPGGQAAAAERLGELLPASAGTAAAPGASTESVLGVDDRRWLRSRTTTFPNSAIGRLDFRQAGRSYWCTGTLIDADTVLTAGHCVHDGLDGEDGWSTRVRFVPGAEGNRAPFGSCEPTELLTMPLWYAEGREYQDLGLVQLDCRIGEVVGWFGYRAVNGRTTMRNVSVMLRGYPGDKVWSSLWNDSDRIRVSQARMLFYAADTYGGQSGSPVFNVRRCNGVRGACILGVHAYGVHGAGPHGRFNHGPRLDPARLAIVAAVAAAPGVG